MSDYKNVQPLDDFNWDSFENGSTTNVSKEDLEKAYDETLNKIQDHEVVEGTVTSIDKKEVVVNIGYKSDGIIPASEFRYNPDLKVGDKVEVYVEDQEDKKGQLVLSHKKARLAQRPFRNSFQENEQRNAPLPIVETCHKESSGRHPPTKKRYLSRIGYPILHSKKMQAS